MKNHIILVLILLSTIQLYAQNSNVLPSIETITYNNQTINFQDTSIFTNLSKPRFQLGWHWAGPNKVTNERLHTNFFQYAVSFAPADRTTACL